MYSPYSSTTQRNKSRLYLILCLTFLALIIYWRYSPAKKQTFQSAGKQIDETIQQGKQKVKDINEKADDLIDSAKDKIKVAADNVKQVADHVKKNL